MTSSHHGPYVLGCKRPTMAVTEGSQPARGSQSQKDGLSSDCRLQFAYMKLESLVIAISYAAVNVFLSLVHTARQAMEIGSTLSRRPNRKGGGAQGKTDNWD